MSGKNTKEQKQIPLKYLEMAQKMRDMSELEFCDMSKQLALRYVQLELPENDDPVDDFLRVLSVALKAMKETGQSPINAPNTPKPEKKGVAKPGEMVSKFSIYLHAIAPILTVAKWEILLTYLLSAKYGGTKVRIRKKPGNAKRAAAKGLTIKDIQEKLGVSRTYAYKLYREVNKTVKK